MKMFPTSSPGYTRGTRTRRKQPTVKYCRLCCSECDEENGLDYNPKLPDLCRKYLHSSLTQEMPSESDDLPFCPKCFVSAMGLYALSEQMEFIQKSVSELVFMFSLEVLHRRGIHSKPEGTAGKKLIEFDVSVLPNNDSWSIPNEMLGLDTPVSSTENSQEITPKNIEMGNVDNQGFIPDFTYNQDNNETLIEQIKCETNLEVWVEEGANFGEAASFQDVNFEAGADSVEAASFPDVNFEAGANSREAASFQDVNFEEGANFDDVETSDVEFLLEKENAEENSKSRNVNLEIRLPTPILQLPKLKLQSDGKQIIVEKDMNYFMFHKDQKAGIRKTVWSKGESGNSYRIAQQNPALLHNQWIGQPEAPSFLSAELQLETTNEQAPKRRRRKKFAKSNQVDQNKEKPYKCSFCKKRFTFQARMITHKMSHLGEKPYECPLCPKSFAQSNSLSYHYRLLHTKEHPFQCTHCRKGFVRRWDLIRHVRTHTGEKPFQCDKCDFSAALLSNLRDHKIKHHSDV